jgi:hypothetical protein
MAFSHTKNIVRCESSHTPIYLIECKIDPELATMCGWSPIQTFAVCDDCYKRKQLFSKFALEVKKL